MTETPAVLPPLEMWGGVECTVNRVGGRWFDQLTRSGHDGRLDDLDRFADLGIQSLRYPVLWERLAPRALDDIDWRWTDERLERLRDLGIRPIVGLLHHGSGPAYTSLLDEEFPMKLAAFAGAVARRYPWLRCFTPVNEPLTTARFSALYGHWYPHACRDAAFIRAFVNQLRGTVLAMRAIRHVIPAAELVQTEDCGLTAATRPLWAQAEHEGHRRWLTWDVLSGLLDVDHPLWPFLSSAGFSHTDREFFLSAACPPDLVGLNYYVTSDRFLDHRAGRYPAAFFGGNGQSVYADVEAVRASPRGIVGHEAHLMAAWKRYRRPLALTEVHLACTRDEQLRWLLESWRAAEAARAQGVDVRGVTAWALLGSYDWDSLVTADAGHYEPGVFDVRGPTPRPTALAAAVASLADGVKPELPAAEGHGWWRRPDRLLHPGPVRATAPAPWTRPMLIIGTGRIGQGLQRACQRRGLNAVIASHREIDIGQQEEVEVIVRRVAPWAVVNAAGYTRLDDAERDPVSCHRTNADGAANLAAACERHGASLMMFSSNYVFDGQARRPYTEEDVPRPLSVYGATQAEAERRVLAALPHGLVIRTSDCFDARDTGAYIDRVLRALGRGAAFEAATDTTVSPTYIPDLIDMSLDLLIDAEHGLWHLANDGAVTWLEFARLAARHAGYNPALVTAVETRATSSGAPRPAFGALASCRGRLLRPLDAALDAWAQRRGGAAAVKGKARCVSS
jgi:dTDP-4-dehydrorhamnose reductase